MLDRREFLLPAADQKAEYVLKQFDRIAWQYDLANDVISFGMHRLWKASAVKALALRKDGQYLDLCCGTGDLALRIADQLSPQGQVVGVDFSQKMLAIAQLRTRQWTTRPEAKAKISWMTADAQTLPFADQTFDGAIISFGLRNLTNLEKGIAEMARVVKVGGKVVNLDLGHPTAPILSSIYYFYFNRLLPLIGRALAGDQAAYSYLPASLTDYPKPDGITAIFQKAKLSKITYHPLAGGAVALHTGTVA